MLTRLHLVLVPCRIKAHKHKHTHTATHIHTYTHTYTHRCTQNASAALVAGANMQEVLLLPLLLLLLRLFLLGRSSLTARIPLRWWLGKRYCYYYSCVSSSVPGGGQRCGQRFPPPPRSHLCIYIYI